MVVICCSVFVYYDAGSLGIKRGLIKGFFDMEPIEWALATAGFWPLVFPFYLLMRPEYISLLENYQALGESGYGGEETEHIYYGMPEHVAEKLGMVVSLASLLLAVGCLFFIGNELGGMSMVGGEIGLLVGKILGYMNWGVLWFIGFTPATLVFLMTRKFEKTVTIVKEPEKITGETKPCRFCGELIGKNAIHCRYCAKDLVKLPKAALPTVKSGPAVGHKAVITAGAGGGSFAKPSGSDEKEVEKDWLAQGSKLLKEGQWKGAIISLSHAIRQDAKNGKLYYARAVAYNKTGEKDKAKVDLRKAAEFGYAPAKKQKKR